MKRCITFILPLCVLLTGCPPEYIMKPALDISSHSPGSFATDNLLIDQRIQLALPDNFIFTYDSQYKDVPFSFTQPDGWLFGFITRHHYEDARNIDPESAAKVYADCDGCDQLELYPTKLDDIAAYIVQSTDRSTGVMDRFIAMLPDGKDVAAIYLYSPENALRLRPDTAFRVYNTYTTERSGVSERRRKQFLCFRCDDEVLSWCGDIQTLKTGYWVVGTRGTWAEDWGIQIERSPTGTFSTDWKTDPEYASVKEETAGRITIGTATFDCRWQALRWTTKNKYHINILVSTPAGVFHVMIALPDGSVPDINTFFEWEQFKRIFSNYFFLS